MIYLQLFLTFLKVGAFAFGGGYAMLSLIGDSVLAYGWMTEEYRRIPVLFQARIQERRLMSRLGY